MTLLTFTAPCCCGAGRAAIDRYLLPAGPTAANPPHAAAESELDRQTDGHSTAYTMRYDTKSYSNVRSKADISQLYLPHAPHTMRALPVTETRFYV